MAFLDEVGKAVGLATQGLSDAAQAIGNAAQETRDNIIAERQERQIEKETQRKIEEEKRAEDMRKCPKCGQSLSGMLAVCPMCGYEIRNARTVSSINDLTKELARLESKRNTIADAVAKTLSGRENTSTDEKIASLIRNFIVPNTKEDVFEFMILAAGNMPARVLAGKERSHEVAGIVIRAWASKFEQTYQKAQISFGNDSDFKKIQDLYDKKNQEIEDAKGFSFLRRK